MVISWWWWWWWWYCDDDDDVDLIRCQAFAPSTLAVWFIGFPSPNPLSTCTRSISEAQAMWSASPSFGYRVDGEIFINIRVKIWRGMDKLNIFSNFSTLLDCIASWVSEALPKSRLSNRLKSLKSLGMWVVMDSGGFGGIPTRLKPCFQHGTALFVEIRWYWWHES